MRGGGKSNQLRVGDTLFLLPPPPPPALPFLLRRRAHALSLHSIFSECKPSRCKKLLSCQCPSSPQRRLNDVILIRATHGFLVATVSPQNVLSPSNSQLWAMQHSSAGESHDAPRSNSYLRHDPRTSTQKRFVSHLRSFVPYIKGVPCLPSLSYSVSDSSHVRNLPPHHSPLCQQTAPELPHR